MNELFNDGYNWLFQDLSQVYPVEELDKDEVIGAHDYIIERWGGRPGIIDHNALSSACFKTPYINQHHESGERNLYDQAAIYMWNIARSHPFADGNKRTAVAAALLFLQNNGVETKFDQVLLQQLVCKCANSHFVGLDRRWSYSEQDAMNDFLKCRR